MDYVIVKMPRWNFEKFYGSVNTLGLQMKSVGEVMAIGRNFLEAMQKACQSQENGRSGLGADKKEWISWKIASKLPAVLTWKAKMP